ncbi:hypothetical protein LXL04_030316 [Taraxacum kok-saghyz]
MLHGRWWFGEMTKGPCQGLRKMMGRSANGGCGTEEKHCPVSISRVPTKFSPEDKDAPLARLVGIDFYAQACKALAVLSPFDLEDGQKKSSAIVSTLPGGLASCLSKHSDSRKRHKKSHLGSDTKKNKSSSRQEKPRGNTFWSETEDYFRELKGDDIERLNEASSFRGNKFISIPYPGNNNETNNHSGVVVASGEDQDVNHSMEVDDTCTNEISNNQREDDTACSLPQSSSGVEWLLGSRSKTYLTSDRPSKKRKIIGGEAGLEKLFVALPVKDQGPSSCCHYCSLGDTGNQLNKLIVCTSCGVAVHQRCYGVQQDDEAGCWVCSWCKLKKDEDKNTNSHCLLCPQQGGALKPVRKRGTGNDDGGLLEFAHLFCCQWMLEVYIEDTKSMEPIMNIEGIKETQKKLICYLCKVKCGACVRCSYGSCRTSFHPLCAREAKHRMEIWGKFGCDDVELRAFCLKHSGPQKDHNPHVENLSVGVEDAKVNDYSNFTLLLKKLIERGKVNLKDVASDINVSANLLASNLADDSLPPDLHGRIVKWLKTHAHVGSLQKNLKLKVISPCISKPEKESPTLENNSEHNNSPVKSSPPPWRRTKGNIRVLKDNSLILSLKRSSGDDGVVMNDDKNGGELEDSNNDNNNNNNNKSSPDSTEKAESCPASVSLAVNTSDCGQPCEAAVSNHDTCPDTIRTEASHTSYVHPLILMQNQALSDINADVDDEGSKCKQTSLMDANATSDSECNHQNQTSQCELDKSKVASIINMSPVDEVEGELVYYQHHLLHNAVSRKHISDGLICKVIKCLPEEIETLRKQNWDAVLVSQYLSEIREVKKQGRKERRHKEAQAVLAAATAAAAASSRLSSFRKDTLDHHESIHQENKLKIKGFGGRSALHAQPPKETHTKLSVTWTPPETNIDSSPSSTVGSRVCDVCRRVETVLNAVIVCSSCKVAVHIDCYRSVKDSKGPWFCELCEDMLSSRSRGAGVPSFSYSEKPSPVAECCLCGGATGAFRKSTDGQWVHALCAEWVLESTFRRGQAKPIQGMETISKGYEVCLVCSRKVGVCIKCNYGHCQSTFHPTCGKTAGFLMNVRSSGGKIQHKAYCEKHSLVERTKAETQKHGVEEWNSLKKVRVELERLRLICERIIKREKLKRELVICSHDTLHWNRESVSSSVRTCTGFVSPDVSSESATTSLRGGYTNSYSETIQRSDDSTTVAGKRRIRFPMENDQKTDDSSTSQIFTQIPPVTVTRPILSGKQIPHRPSRSTSDDGDKFFRHAKHTETFEKELVMTSDQASMRNQRLPKGFVYVPIRVLSNEDETLAAANAGEENSGHDA